MRIILCDNYEELSKKAAKIVASQITLKPDSLISIGTEEERKNALHAKTLIEKSRNLDSVALSSEKILYPSEYTIRANMLIEARRLVGGVVLEKN